MSDTSSLQRCHELLVGLSKVVLADDYEPLCARAVEWYRATLGADRALLVLPFAGEDGYRVVADSQETDELHELLRSCVEWSPTTEAWPVALLPVPPAAREALTAQGCAHLVAAHLMGRRGTVGVLVGLWSGRDDPGEEVVSLASACAIQVGAALDRLHDRDALMRESILHEVVALADSSASLEEVLQHALQIVLGHPDLGVESRGAAFLKSPQGHLQLVASTGLPSATLRACAVVPSGWCLCGRALERDEVVVKAHVDCEHDQPDLGGVDHGHLVLPMRSDAGLEGVLTLYLRAGRRLSPPAVANLEFVASAMGRLVERIRLRVQLAQQANTFRALLDHAPITAAVHRDGRFVYVNAAMATSLGYDRPEQLIGVEVASIVHPDDRGKVEDRARYMLSTGQMAPLTELCYIHASGSTIYADTIALPVDFEGEPSIFVMAQDITDRKAIQARSALADRLASLGQLAAMIGHDINNPLTYVRSNLEFALASLATTPAGTRQILEDPLRDALQGADFIGTVTSDLRTFVRETQPGDPEFVRLADAIAFVSRMVAGRYRNAAKVAVDVVPDVYVQGEPSRVAQVFMNLVLNGAQAVLGGSDPRVEIRGRRVGDLVIVEVQDWGCGMDPEQLESACKPFVTTKASGTGLGLYITRTIVEELHGWLELQSEVGSGTTVRVTLPASNGGSESITGEFPAQPGRRRVLLIDDDEMALRSMMRLFDVHMDVDGVVGGRAGLERLLNRGDTYDLVLCDVVMPDLDGPGLYEAVVAAGRGELRERLVFMTGGVFDPDTVDFLRRARAPLVFKPVMPATVLRELSKALKSRGAPPGVLTDGSGE